MKEKKKVLLIDMANLGIRTAITTPFNPIDPEPYRAWKVTIIRSLKNFILLTGATSVVLCLEGKKNWRYGVYDAYKSDRKEKNAKLKVDFETYYPMFDEFMEKMKQYFSSLYQLKVESAEGDDLVGVLTKFLQNYEVYCVSTDRDFFQLLKYPNYHQYHPIKKQYVQVVNPERYLLEKIIVGDKGDGVPHVKPKVSVKTAPKIIDAGLEEWLKKEGVEKEFERNKKLIDFDCIPIEVQDKIMTAMREYKWNPMSPGDFSAFCSNECLSTAFFDKLYEYANTFINLRRIDIDV